MNQIKTRQVITKKTDEIRSEFKEANKARCLQNRKVLIYNLKLCIEKHIKEMVGIDVTSVEVKDAQVLKYHILQQYRNTCCLLSMK